MLKMTTVRVEPIHHALRKVKSNIFWCQWKETYIMVILQSRNPSAFTH